jgi:ribosome-associated protein
VGRAGTGVGRVSAPEDDDDLGSARESSRERSARMREIAAIANKLVKLQPAQLANVPLSEELAEAVADGQRFTKNALARQLRRIAGLLRATELAPIEAALREIETGRGVRSRREQTYEHWRTRLLEGGDAELTAFVAAHPGADVQVLRQHVRNATKAPESPRGKGAARELLRAIRALGEAATSTSVDDE